MVTDQIATADTSETFEFTGNRGPFFRLLLINLLLTILTLGIYRFWAKTKVRKFIWSNIRFMGDPLEYTGKATELFLGFLIVLAILFPIGLVYSAIDHLVPPENTAMRVTLEAIYYMVLFALIQIGFYRAWRYRMSRTTWRGIRLGLDGSTWAYLKISFGWTILTALTLGLAYPWMAVELWRYQITHTRIGETAATYSGSGRDLILPWLCVLGPSLILFCGLALSVYLSGDPMKVVIRDVVFGKNTDPTLTILLIASAASYLAVPVTWFWFSINLIRYKISGTTLTSASLHSDLPFARLFSFAVLSIAVVLIPTLAIGAVLFMSDGTIQISDATIQGSLILFSFLGILLGFLVFPLVWALIYTFEFIKQVFITTIITNPEALEYVIQSAATSQKTGEGLADALDIGGL